jgi:ribosomal protein S18 acetylase RimI-like enzyme
MNVESLSTSGDNVVREVLSEDSEQLAAILTELDYPATLEFVRGRLANLSLDNETKVLVADYGGNIAGFVSVQLLPNLRAERPSGRITALVVRSEFRRGGVGRMLIAAAEHSLGSRVVLGWR